VEIEIKLLKKVKYLNKKQGEENIMQNMVGIKRKLVIVLKETYLNKKQNEGNILENIKTIQINFYIFINTI